MIINGFLRETAGIVWFYRAMGATIGCDVVLSGNTFGNILDDFDLIDIGDNAFIDQGCTVSGHDVQNGMLLLGRVHIGARCIVGACSTVMPGTDLPDGVEIGPMSLTNAELGASSGEVWQGCPAQLGQDQIAKVPHPRSLSMKALQIAGLVLIVIMLMISVAVPWLISIAITDTLLSNIFIMTVGILPFGVTFLALVLALKWVLLGKTRVGLYDATAWNMARLWLVDTVLQSSIMQLSLGLILDPTVGVPTYLRLLGAKIGTGVCLFYPQFRLGIELVEVRDGTVFGGQVMPCCMDWHHDSNTIELAPITLGEESFVANGVVLQRGTVLEEKATLGLLSCMPPFSCAERECAYMGSPARSMSTTREDDETQTLLLQSIVQGDEEAAAQDVGTAHRCVVSATSFVMPVLSMTFFSGLTCGMYYGTLWFSNVLHFESLVLKLLVLVLNMLLVVLVELVAAASIKRMFCPKFVGRTAMWSYSFLSWEIFGTVIAILSDTILSSVQGTALMASWLRLLGAEIGDGVYFDTAPPVETDRLVIKDGATLLNAPQSLVPHTLDRGMLQFAQITLEKNASISLNTCLNLHSSVGEGAVIGASSVLMKAEKVPAYEYAEGNPSMLSKHAPAAFLPVETEDACCRWLCQACSGCALGCSAKFMSCLRCGQEDDPADASVMVPLFDDSKFQPSYNSTTYKN